MRLEPRLQRYAWGDRRFIPERLRLPVTDEPCAEAWFGAHPAAPARARVDEGTSVPLDALIAADPDRLLGAETAARFGELPYLLKLLAAARPLSIQVHPSPSQAAAGFGDEEARGVPRGAPHRRYRDAHHKPELFMALTDFHGLCGFRGYDELTAALAALPELSAHLPPLAPGPAGLRALLEAYFALGREVVEPALDAIAARLTARERERASTPDEPAYWALEAHRERGPDRGIFFVFLLAHVHLSPGQAMFLPAGVPHAYLRGAGVEIMAASDNVLRCGLTSKHVDPAELMRTVRFDAGPPPVLEPLWDEAGVEGRFPVAAHELDLRPIKLSPGQTISRRANGADTLLVLEGEGVEVTGGGATLVLARGESCWIPHGLDYRVRAPDAAQLVRATLPAPEAAQDYRGRSPVRLAFGTSGLRGLVTDITDLEAYLSTRGFLDYLVSIGDAVPGTPVALAGDLRPSTDGPGRSILRAVARAVSDAGLSPVHCGRIPTPALTAYALSRGWPSVMVTGSHIPFDRNGIKFNKSTGEVLKSDEAPILAAIERVRDHEYRRRAASSPFDDDGWFRDGPRPWGAPVDDGARRHYVARYTAAFPADALSGLRVVVYEHSAVGREILAEILRALGAEVHPARRAEGFVAIDTEAIDAAQLAALQALADEQRARLGRIDAIVSTDGDSDRPLVLAVEPDGRARFVSGDALGMIVADRLGADAIAVPISATDAIEAHFGAHAAAAADASARAPTGARASTPAPAARSAQVVRTRIGSPWVIAAMAAQHGARRVGWEANGGFLVGSRLTLEGGGALDPLPTRDAVLPIVTVLSAARARGVGVGALVDALPARFTHSGLLDGVPPEASRALADRFGPARPDLRAVRFGEGGATWQDRAGEWRPAQGALRARVDELHAALSSHFAARGFAPIAAIDHLDGLRISFAGGDVAHVRASGNAPQLRIYATADSAARAEAIVAMALAPERGLLAALLEAAKGELFVTAIRRNIAVADELFAPDGQGGAPAGVIGTVCGSAGAQRSWQDRLDAARAAFRARRALSFHEDLPVNQALGLLLLWQRLRPELVAGEGALVAFVFGEGSRAAPLTQAEGGQKPGIASFVRAGGGRFLSTVELALRTFAPVESYLRRSGFDGVVVKWGDEVQIPTLDLAGTNPLFAGADVVRFVSVQEMTEDLAANKDWVGVDAAGRVTAFIPRRPLAEMRALADRGLIQERRGKLYGGVNLGSVALSRALLEVLHAELVEEVNDPTADRRRRPDLDPQLFTALTIAALGNADERAAAYTRALQESAAMRALDQNMPGILDRLRRVLDRYQDQHGRPVRMVAMDFGDQYWGDIGQHRQMYEWLMALTAEGAQGAIARALAGLPDTRDDRGNIIAGDTRLGPRVEVRNSVLIDAVVEEGDLDGAVLVGTRARRLWARRAFDVLSVARDLWLDEGSGGYKVVSEAPVRAAALERVTTVFLAERELLMRVSEATELRDRKGTYEVPVLGNALSFEALQRAVLAADPARVEARRRARIAEVWGA